MRVRPLQLPPPLRLPSSPQWGAKGSAARIKGHGGQGSNLHKHKSVKENNQESEAAEGEEEGEEEEGQQHDIEAAASSARRVKGSSPLWSATRWASMKLPLETPDLSSLPMSPSNALRAARTMAHRLESDKTITTTPRHRLLSARLGSTSPSAACFLYSARGETATLVPFSAKHIVKRAYFGTLLAIIERPKSANRCLSVTTNYVWPLLEMLIEFVQFSLFNAYIMPPGAGPALRRIASTVGAVVVFQASSSYYSYSSAVLGGGGGQGFPSLIFTISVALVAAIALSLLLLALQFGRQGERSVRRPSINPSTGTNGTATATAAATPSSCCATSSGVLYQPLASYINFVSGALYIPLLNLLSLEFLGAIRQQQHTDAAAITTATATLLCLAFLVPFCLFMSQNQGYVRDEHAFHLRKRRHNRLNLLVITVKTVGIAVGGGLGSQQQQQEEGGLNRIATIANFLLFSALLSAHFFTNVYYHVNVNRAYAGLYMCLVWGSLCRLVSMPKYGGGSTGSDEPYWILLAPVFVLGWAVQVVSEHVAVLHHWRYTINSFLVSRLKMLDLADNPTTIYRYGLSGLLRSATRMGTYAKFLAEHDPDDPQVERLFLKALKQEPRNAEILGGYADYLVNKAGREEEASRLYRRAVEADGDNRENLEGYAKFLRERDSPEALYYYQRSLLQYYQHYEYRDLYVNSMEPMMIVDGNGTVLDCNGAALFFFRARRRNQLCNRPRFLLELVQQFHVEAFKRKLRDMILKKGGANSASFEATVLTFSRVETPVLVLLSRLKHGGRCVVQVALKDMTALRTVNERVAKLELRHRQLDILHKVMMSQQSEHRELSRQLFENGTTCHVLASFPSLAVERYSSGAEQALAFPRKVMLGAPLTALVPPAILADYIATLPADFGLDNTSTTPTNNNNDAPTRHHHHHRHVWSGGESPVRGGGGSNASSLAASPRTAYEQLPTCDVDLTVTCGDGTDKTFAARLSAVAVGEAGPRYLLLSMHDTTRFYPPHPSSSSSCPAPFLSDLLPASSPTTSSSSMACPRAAPAPPETALLSSLSHALLDSHPLPLLLADARGSIDKINPRAQALLGYTPQDAAAGHIKLSNLLTSPPPTTTTTSTTSALLNSSVGHLLMMMQSHQQPPQGDDADKDRKGQAEEEEEVDGSSWKEELLPTMMMMPGGGSSSTGQSQQQQQVAGAAAVLEVWVLAKGGVRLPDPLGMEVLELCRTNDRRRRFLITLHPPAPPPLPSTVTAPSSLPPSPISGCSSPVLFTSPPLSAGSSTPPRSAVPSFVPPLPVNLIQQPPPQHHQHHQYPHPPHHPTPYQYPPQQQQPHHHHYPYTQPPPRFSAPRGLLPPLHDNNNNTSNNNNNNNHHQQQRPPPLLGPPTPQQHQPTAIAGPRHSYRTSKREEDDDEDHHNALSPHYHVAINREHQHSPSPPSEAAAAEGGEAESRERGGQGPQHEEEKVAAPAVQHHQRNSSTTTATATEAEPGGGGGAAPSGVTTTLPSGTHTSNLGQQPQQPEEALYDVDADQSRGLLFQSFQDEYSYPEDYDVQPPAFGGTLLLATSNDHATLDNNNHHQDPHHDEQGGPGGSSESI